ncbi:7197_t:CDS:1, partial [Funneliformis geosporum]
FRYIYTKIIIAKVITNIADTITTTNKIAFTKTIIKTGTKTVAKSATNE